jgi:cAMP phosphodiesterase
MEHDEMLMKATSREELQQATLTKMKSVTGAEEDVCVAMLESNGYDLTTSIETFYIKK